MGSGSKGISFFGAGRGKGEEKQRVEKLPITVIIATDDHG